MRFPKLPFVQGLRDAREIERREKDRLEQERVRKLEQDLKHVRRQRLFWKLAAFAVCIAAIGVLVLRFIFQPAPVRQLIAPVPEKAADERPFVIPEPSKEVVVSPPAAKVHYTCGPGTVYVAAHTRKNGTHVAAYCRATPGSQ